MNTLISFNHHSGQIVSTSKSKVIFSNNYSKEDRELLAHELKIKAIYDFGNNLGFSIFHQKPLTRDYQFILDNLRHKIGGWKTKFLNMTGRTTQARAFLGRIPNHLM